MKILLLGKNGQVGWELQRSLATLGELIALDRNSQEYCGDLSKLDKLALTVQKIRPDVIVNAAAYTAVDMAEKDSNTAKLINQDAVAVLAIESEKIGALLVHYSTDYVFDGSGKEFRLEEDLTSPLNVYGESKRNGETAIIEKNPRHLIFRTSWVYGRVGRNFIKTIIELAKNRQELSIVDDQVGAPTGADLIADCTAIAIRKVFETKSQYGVYHLVSSGETSWYGYTKYIIKQLEKVNLPLTVRDVIPVPSSAHFTPAKRPHNSRLSNEKIQSVFDINIPNWNIGVKRLIVELS